MIIERSLIHYIERALEIGFTREKIEWSLFEVGWPLHIIKRSYRVAYMIHAIHRGYRVTRAAGKTGIYALTNYRMLPRYIARILRAYAVFLWQGFTEDIRETRSDYLAMKIRIKKRYGKLARPHASFETTIIPPNAHAPAIGSRDTRGAISRNAGMASKSSAPNSPMQESIGPLPERASQFLEHQKNKKIPGIFDAVPSPLRTEKSVFRFLAYKPTGVALRRCTIDLGVRIRSAMRAFRAEWSRVLRIGTAKVHTAETAFEDTLKTRTAAIYKMEVALGNTIKERLGTTEQEVFGFMGFLVSNTVRGLEEFLYDIIHILIVTPYFAIKNFVVKVMPHPAIALPSSRSHHVSQEFEYRGALLPGHIRGIDIIELSSRMFRTRRMRTFLTVLGISIGIGTILFLVSLGYGLQSIIFERIATTESLLTLDVTTGEKEIISLDRSGIEKMAALPGVTEVSPLASINGQVSINDLSANTQIRAIHASYFNLGGIRAARGRIFEEGERDKAVVSLAVMRLFSITNPEDIIGKQAQFNLLFTNNEIGDTEVARHATTYEIVGVIEDTETSFVYLPLVSLDQFNISTFSQVKIKMTAEQNAEAIRSEIINMGFFVSAVSDILDQATKIFQAIQIVLAVFGLVALIVSAIGMFNTMTIALLERTQEIGIMKALGATPRDIWLMFLSESVIMGFLGGIGGILTGIIGAEIFNIGIGLLANAVGASSTNLFQRPLWFIITIAVFSTLIGFITGLWPAHRASKLNTLAALRYK